MKRIFFVALLLGFSTFFCIGKNSDTTLLRRQIGQMIVSGFIGFDASDSGQYLVAHAVQELGVGGVIYFDRNVQEAVNRRNIESPNQLKKLSAQLQQLASAGGHPELFIAIDQEGGRVSRLKRRYGFPPTVSAQYLGNINNVDTTRKWASQTAKTCRSVGVNVNFAPCVDVNVNPQSPVIGKIERSFSEDPKVVTAHARIWVDELNEQGILTSLKHFPGHGSSLVDSHLGLTDITTTWQRDRELAPYVSLFGDGYADMVMVGHLMHLDVDPKYPASLSRRWITDILRDELGYNGVVITDDMNMGAIVDHYSLERAMELAINAGVDMIIIGNNGKIYEKDLTPRTINIIIRLVEKGRIPKERIDEAYKRIMKLKRSLKEGPGN